MHSNNNGNRQGKVRDFVHHLDTTDCCLHSTSSASANCIVARDREGQIHRILPFVCNRKVCDLDRSSAAPGPWISRREDTTGRWHDCASPPILSLTLKTATARRTISQDSPLLSRTWDAEYGLLLLTWGIDGGGWDSVVWFNLADSLQRKRTLPTGWE